MHKLAGRHWLLLRGLCREAAHWGKFPELLQQTFPQSTVNTIDLPGTGRFYQGHSPHSIEAITIQVRRQALADGLLAKPVTVLAFSLGGMVTWEWLQRYPQDIAATALLNTSFAGLSPFYRRMRWQSYPQFLGLLLERDLYERELSIIQLVSNRPEHYPQTAEAWTAIQQARPISFANCVKQLKAAARYRPSQKKPETPLLLLNGRGDRLVAPACSDAIHDKWQIDIFTHPWAGHDLCLDDGAWVANRLKDWMNQPTV
ncbi:MULTISPECIES: alpha/beta fold hydrolase [Methylomonas]|uniref:Alpha/beta hydrolase n=2 Tax=Methylomonas TaxID=416 RepID=A0A126T976_9GAMM|nr:MULTISPECIES: alpha/beta hydrolase [Methylomonas]AMK78639.1 alpha/beta hydrolase [Methylomonas denitrificans]OAI03638.1 alpha/beta hydrolase [Methylomonas methanica]TCV83608.1 pimeloyl-ACP methyl ester carboxylesterase [Methylomonas methanica]